MGTVSNVGAVFGDRGGGRVARAMVCQATGE